MSEELKKKLYNYEMIPADKAWDKIASALDDEINAQFPQLLYEAEVNPPSNTWNKIASTLDADIKEEYPVRLYNFEVVPPANAWEKISEAIEEEKTLSQIPSKRRIVPFVRYAAAACVIGAIAFGTFKLVSHKTASRDVAEKTTTPQRIAPATVQPSINKDSSSQTAVAVSNNLPKERTAALVRTNRVATKKIIQPASYMTLLADAMGVTNSAALDFQQANLKVGEVPGNCAVISEEDRYVNFMNPDGYLVRISKKLAEALKCYLPTANTPESQCDEQIRKWRDKIAQSPASSSPDNFMDVLNIIKAAQEKEL